MLRFVLSALVLAGCVTPALAEYKLEIGPDTTVIDGPMNPDGTINYLAYLNEKLSEGVTPENNFAVDVAMTMGEDTWVSEGFRVNVFKALGVELPAVDSTFVKYQTFLGISPEDRETDRRWEQSFDNAKEPWTTEEYPELKRWLDEQGAVLDRIASSTTRKDSYYFPIVFDDDEPHAICDALLPWLGQLRIIARGLGTRAQWHIAAGDLEAAWSDILAMRRMANLSMQEPYIISWLVGVSIHSMAITVMEDLVSSDRLTTGFARQAIADSRDTSMMPGVTVSLDMMGRLGPVDLLQFSMKHRGETFELAEQTYTYLQNEEFDPNFALREINRRINLLVVATEQKDQIKRIQALEELDEQFGEVFFQTMDMVKGKIEMSAALRAEIEQSNVITVIGTHMFVGQVSERPAQMMTIEVSTRMRLDLQLVAFAVAGYHATKGEYPPDLNALVPLYLDSLPTDFATGELPVYRVEEGKAIIYSLGTNLKDDGGMDDNEDGDIVFRIER